METQVDRMGRVVIPKPLRDALDLVPGTKIDVSFYGAGLRLIPRGRSGRLTTDGHGRLVITGDTTLADETLFAIIDASRR